MEVMDRGSLQHDADRHKGQIKKKLSPHLKTYEDYTKVKMKTKKCPCILEQLYTGFLLPCSIRKWKYGDREKNGVRDKG